MAETFTKTLATAVTSGTQAVPDPCGVYDAYEGICEWSAGVSAGVVTFEWAAEPDYADTWETLFTLGPPAAPAQVTHDSVNVKSGFIRYRITTPIVGGTVTIKRALQVAGK